VTGYALALDPAALPPEHHHGTIQDGRQQQHPRKPARPAERSQADTNRYTTPTATLRNRMSDPNERIGPTQK
jgi:hypothetical protein